MPELRKFFITHSWKDIHFARRLFDDLTAHGLEGFMDDKTLQGGHRLAEEINHRLEWCEVYIPILSPAALESPWCWEEINAAISLANRRGRMGRPRIVSVLADDCQDKLPSLLISRLYFEFTGRYDSALKELLSKGFGLQVETKYSPRSIHSSTSPGSEPNPTPNSPSVQSGAILRQDRVQPPVSSPLKTMSQAELERLYEEALEAFHLERWTLAAKEFRKIASVQPDYEDARAKLDEAEWRQRVISLYDNGSQCIAAKKWTEAVQSFESLLVIAPGYRDAETRLAEAQSWVQLPGLYRQALKAIDAKKWLVAAALLAQVRQVDTNYREAKQLWDRVQEELSRTLPRTRAGKDGKAMVLIPAGEFLMGSEERHDEKPVHRVYVDGFYIDRYPVTNAEYKKFVVATWSLAPQHWANGQIPSGEEDHPVVYVSWEEAASYAKWVGGRLPTEAEWEKAASWDDVKKEKRRYPWGNEFDPGKCNTIESKIGNTTPVGRYSPGGDSAYGGGDMAGNVWEWCADWYDSGYYRRSPDRNPTGPDSGQVRALRGGSWYYNSGNAQCAYRNFNDPVDQIFNVGFRVAESFP